MLRWERRSPSTWLATCDSADCGQITLPVSQHQELREFLGVSAQPITKPWTRLFLRAAALDGPLWSSARTECPDCNTYDFFFRALLYPNPDPYEAALCLNCGATITRHTIEGTSSELHGGHDWATPDPAVGALRSAIRALAERDDDTGETWEFRL